MSVGRPVAWGLLSRLMASGAVAPSSSPALAPAASICRQQHQQQLHRHRNHQFHSSAQLGARRRQRFKSIRAEEMGLTKPEAMDKFAREKFPEYSEEERERMRERYTPEQLAAIEAGEQIVDPKDLAVQGRLRVDPYRMQYIDDFHRVAPVVDKRQKKHPAPPKMDATFMTQDEFGDDFLQWLKGFAPEDVNLADMSDEQLLAWTEKHAPSDLEITRYFHERSSLTDGNAPQNTALAPALPDKVPGVAGLYKRQVDPEEDDRDDSDLVDLKRKTGMTARQIRGTMTKTLVHRFVSNQTRLGKVQSISVLCIAGNRDGRLGLGEAKSVEPGVAAIKARLAAIQNMKPIRRYENRTIYGEVNAKISGTVVQLRSRPPGFGLRVSHRIFEMCRMAGIHDLSAKILRSGNPMNTVKAVYEALTNQPDPEKIAIGRGKKLVDVRKVYYGGAVY